MVDRTSCPNICAQLHNKIRQKGVLPALGVLLLLLLFNGGELLKAESDSAVVELHFVDRLRASSG